MFGLKDGPIFSPSQTQVWKECQLSWYLRYRLKYVPKFYSQKEIAGCIGSAFSIYQEHLPGGHKYARDLAHEDFAKRLVVLQETRELSQRAVDFEKTAVDRLDKFINLYHKTPVIPSRWEIFDREKCFEEYGYSRVDAVYHEVVGDKFGVLDYKTRNRVQANQKDKTRRELATSNQMYQYCAVASDYYGKLVDQFAILILVLEPRPWIDLWQFRVKEETLRVWVEGRKQDWRDMAAVRAGERTPSMATEHENKYGTCQFYKVCFEHSFDEEAIKEDFVIL